MSADTAFQRLRGANPVPRPELLKGQQSRDLSVLLTAARQRSHEIPSEEVVEAKPRSVAPRKKWVLVLAALSAILFIGIAVFLNSRPESDVVDTPDPVLGVFESVGEMPIQARQAVALSEGTVLIFGETVDGTGTSVLAFDPLDRTFTAIGSIPTYLDSATPLADGIVLVMGGTESGYGGELFDPATRSSTSIGPPIFDAWSTTAVRLANGRVLLVGGEPEGATASAQIFDPATGVFAVTGSMARPRGLGATATLLASGQVLVAGGDGDPDGRWAMAEIYDPATGTFTETGHMSEGRSGHTATLLKDGRVLLTGGYPGDTNSPITAGDLYDPDTGTFSPTGPMQIPRIQHVAAILRDGRVLIAGGNIASGNGDGSYLADGLAEAEIFDPETGQFTMTAPMRSPRGNAGSAVLPNGDVLIVGHANFAGGGAQQLNGAENTVEVFR